jgi:hypothetical protein
MSEANYTLRIEVVFPIAQTVLVRLPRNPGDEVKP